MRRHFAIISALFLVAGLGSAVLVAQAAKKPGGPKQTARQFVGYWMGIDPLDGGDVRRGITANGNGTFSMIGHDSFLTLCDGTDRGIIRVSDFKPVGSKPKGKAKAAAKKPTLVSDNHILTCTNNGTTRRLKNRTVLIDKNIIRETVTTQEGQFVDKTFYHRVSEQ
jgi:hypothetical protein